MKFQKGHIVSPELRQKLSLLHKGQVRSVETRKRLSKKLKGRVLSEETKKKMSQAKKGISFSTTHRQNLSAAKKGTKLTEEHKSKIGLSHKGKLKQFCIKGHNTVVGGKTRSGCKICAREYHWQRTLGILNTQGKSFTQLDYNQTYLLQEGKCAICNKSFKVLCVDHDHSTKLARGLLCTSCNTGLGKFGEDINLLQKAKIYLDREVI